MKQQRPLSYTAEDVLNFIRRYKREHNGIAPTMREIAAAVGLASTSTASHHVNALERRGHIRRAAHRPRWIELVEEAPAPNG